MKYSARSEELVPVAGLEGEWFIDEARGGNDYRLYCAAPGHRCRVRNYATFRRAREGALIAEADGHKPGLYVHIVRGAIGEGSPLGRGLFEIRLDHRLSIPTAAQGTSPFKLRLRA